MIKVNFEDHQKTNAKDLKPNDKREEDDTSPVKKGSTVSKQASQVMDKKQYGQRTANALLKIIMEDEDYTRLSKSEKPK